MRALHVGALQQVALLFSALGSEPFYLLLLPLFYWLYDRKIGARLGILLLISVLVNDLFKIGLHLPRPYQVDAALMPFSPLALEKSFGFPSGHAQGAFMVWPFLALRTNNKSKWLILAYILAFCITLSRLILGVHWPLDVVGGALIGTTILWSYERYGDFMERSFRGQALINQAIFAVVFSAVCWVVGSLLIADAVRDVGPTTEALVKAPADLIGRCAALLGLVFGLMFAPHDVLAGGTVAQKAGRVIVGLIGVAIFYVGLKMAPQHFLVGFVRYFLTTFWVTCASLWVFRAMGLGGGKAQPQILAAE